MNARGASTTSWSLLFCTMAHIAPPKPEEERGKVEDLEKDTTVDS